MTTKELAKILDGAEYGLRECKAEIELAKENGIVIVYGASDDLMEFCGAIDDEAGVYEGGHVLFTRDGVMRPYGDCDDCPLYKAAIKNCDSIKAIWCPEGTDFAWMYETDIPHEVFRVLEDGEHYCMGIVFYLEDVREGWRNGND